jgi:hypothetical protein
MTKKPAGATVVKPDVTADKDEETASPAAAAAKPAAAPKKKPATTAKPAASKSEPVDEPKREPRPPKVNFNHSFYSFKLVLLLVARAFFFFSLMRHTNIYTCVF